MALLKGEVAPFIVSKIVVIVVGVRACVGVYMKVIKFPIDPYLQ